MEIISKQKYISEVKTIQEKVFSADVLSRPARLFSEKINSRMRIEQINDHQTQEKFWRGLISALRIWNPESIYMYSKFTSNNNEENLCFKFELDDFEEYVTYKKEMSEDLWWVFYYGLTFSSKGEWGLINFCSEFSAIGGSHQLINQLKIGVPNIETDIFAFIAENAIGSISSTRGPSSEREWKEYEEELSHLQRNLYGQEMAEKILAKAKAIGIYGCSYSYKELKAAYDRIVAERSKEKTDYFNL